MSATTRTEIAVLNLIARCKRRVGKSSVGTADWDPSLDCWYNYCDVHLTQEIILDALERLKSFGWIEQSGGGYHLSQLGEAQNETYSNQAEAEATALWEASAECKAFRKKLCQLQMQTLSGAPDFKDAPLFNLMSPDHAAKLNALLEEQLRVLGGREFRVLDVGVAGVMSHFAELFMQRMDMMHARYTFLQDDSETGKRLAEKWRGHSSVNLYAEGLDSFLARDLGAFQLILAIDILYFIRARRELILNALFEKLAPGGALVFSFGAVPGFIEGEEKPSEAILPITHPKSGLSVVFETLSKRADAKVTVHAEPYFESWDRYALAFAQTPETSDAGLERIRFETAQAMIRKQKTPDSPGGRWTVFAQRL
ncbi:MAG: hypothetical protein EBX40_03985 [Gammaproteobacteria bacterium]|nr:hypothetical protein [Gammaproteobacteria bacterium]